MEMTDIVELKIDEKARNYARIYSSLIEDEFQRKRAYASITALHAFANLLQQTDCVLQKAMTIFRNPELNSKYEISDIYINDWHIDVRIMTAGDAFIVPRSHEEYSIEPDFYAVIKVDANLQNARLLGFANPKYMQKDPLDYHYYSVLNSNLITYDEFLETVKNRKIINFLAAEHKFFLENYLGLIDKEIDEESKKSILKHLFQCPKCRAEFCCFTGFEMVNCNLSKYPELLEDQTINIIGAQAVEEEQYEGKEETVYFDDKKREKETSEEQTNEKTEEDDSTEQIETDESPVSDILDELFNSEEDTTSEISNNEEIQESSQVTEQSEDIKNPDLLSIEDSDDLLETIPEENIDIKKEEDDSILEIENEEDISFLETDNAELDILEENEETKEAVDKVIVDYDENGEPIYSYITNVDNETDSDNELDTIEQLEDIENIEPLEDIVIDSDDTANDIDIPTKETEEELVEYFDNTENELETTTDLPVLEEEITEQTVSELETIEEIIDEELVQEENTEEDIVIEENEEIIDEITDEEEVDYDEEETSSDIEEYEEIEEQNVIEDEDTETFVAEESDEYDDVEEIEEEAEEIEEQTGIEDEDTETFVAEESDEYDDVEETEEEAEEIEEQINTEDEDTETFVAEESDEEFEEEYDDGYDEEDYEDDDEETEIDEITEQKVKGSLKKSNKVPLIVGALIVLAIATAGVGFYLIPKATSPDNTAGQQTKQVENLEIPADVFEDTNDKDVFADLLAETGEQSDMFKELEHMASGNNENTAPIDANTAEQPAEKIANNSEETPVEPLSPEPVEVKPLTENDLIQQQQNTDVNKAMANAFSEQNQLVTSIKSLNWVCAPRYFTNPEFKAYLQQLDKAMKVNLNSNILDTTTTPTNDTISYKFGIDNNGTLLKIQPIGTTGSEEIDNIVLQSIKETLALQKTVIISNSSQKSDKYLLQMTIKF